MKKKEPSPLTARFVDTVKKPGRYGDGRGGFGLILNVHKATNGRITKSWIQRLWHNGKAVQIGLGPYPILTLSKARKLVIENRRVTFEGNDPRATGIPTFAEAADKVINIQRPTWRDNGTSERQWRSSLRDYAMPKLDGMAVDQITSADVLGVLTRNDFWNSKRVTAKRVRQRIGAVMKWAVAQGHRADNPAGDVLDSVLPKNGVHAKHHKALPYDRVSAALATVRARGDHRPTCLAFEFLVLTAARSGEVRGAVWSEIDFEARTWTIPGERMKAGREHRVPLSPQAVAILEQARKLSDGDLVFPTVYGRVIQAPVLSVLLRDNGIEAVPHGFRSSFRQWAAEQTDFPREVCEHALAHVNRDQVEAAYQRSDLFEKRRALMDGWTDYVMDNATA